MLANAREIQKFCTLSIAWLAIIFGAVWITCWLIGIVIPQVLQPYTGNEVTEAVSQTCQALVPLLAVMVFIPINAMFMVLVERRALALFTVRRGPCRVGPDGFLQTAADAIKLLFKEDITPRGADAFMFTLAPIIFFAPSIFAAMPLLAAVTNNHPLFSVVNLPTGIFYVLAASSVPVIGLVMGGWASNNKYSLVGGLRSAAQAISYEIPLVMSIITVCLLARTLDVVKIAQQQAGGILNWNLFGGGALTGLDKWFDTIGLSIDKGAEILQIYYPIPFWSALAALILVVCTLLLFGLYVTGACAEINRIPFDLPEAESELVSGYNTEYSGIKFAIFFLAEFTNLFIVSSIATVMFLGGGDCPVPLWMQRAIGIPQLFQALGPYFSVLTDQLRLIDPPTFWALIWVIIKVYVLIFFAILVRGTLPRFRIDQLMDFGWKRLIPLSLILFVIVAFAREAIRFHV